ncbi:peptide-methionine (S)-S-oxide reductase MsrA [Actinomyces minihominis]|uniref:peptide-methionine (S)-S-oxide reductase MsrA n=1 Tax=Actinomyces minihominis TaxID=2002838 RepID=UPI000C07F869|nr:peptide-methionine (S)-S-oxide reductase MsrA [Actinomyces minihominis]
MADTSGTHVVLGTPLDMQAEDGNLEIFLAGGCFWGVERFMWETPGVILTSTGYMGGKSTAPTYVQVCTGFTGHAETVRVIYDPKRVTTQELLAVFFENHDPTQVNRQGNDLGTQYRSAIWTTTAEQFEVAQLLKSAYEERIIAAGMPPIATEIHSPPPPVFYLAEEYHQGYLHKNPHGYCNHGFNGVECPSGVF